MVKKYKYLILLPVPEPERSKIVNFMDTVSTITGIPPPYNGLKPHVSLHRPIVNIREKGLKKIIDEFAKQASPISITVESLACFGQKYIVLPVRTTLDLATFWAELRTRIETLPGYERGEFDYDNTLHITVARDTNRVFEHAWPLVKKLKVPTLTMTISHIELHKKPIVEGNWEMVDAFPIMK